jgi:hypothetical protein
MFGWFRLHQKRFALEPRDAIGVLGEHRRQNLDGHLAVQSGVSGAPNLAHAPAPSLAVMR